MFEEIEDEEARRTAGLIKKLVRCHFWKFFLREIILLFGTGWETWKGNESFRLRQWERFPAIAPNGVQWRGWETKTLTFKRESLVSRVFLHQTNTNPSSLVPDRCLCVTLVSVRTCAKTSSGMRVRPVHPPRLHPFSPWSFASFCNSSKRAPTILDEASTEDPTSDLVFFIRDFRKICFTMSRTNVSNHVIYR